MRKISQNSQASNDKIIQLQNQVSSRLTCMVWMRRRVIYEALCSFLHLSFLIAGRVQWPSACRIRHSSKAAEEPHGGGQVNEPVGELEPWTAGEKPCCRWGEGPVGEGAPASSEHPRLREEELQPGLRGDQGAARWLTNRKPTLKFWTAQVNCCWSYISQLSG